MTSKPTRRQREEKIDELMSLHDALPGWSPAEVCRFALTQSVIPIRLTRPQFHEFGYTDESAYRDDRLERQSVETRLNALPWVVAVATSVGVGTGSMFVAGAEPYFVYIGIGGLITGAFVGSLY